MISKRVLLQKRTQPNNSDIAMLIVQCSPIENPCQFKMHGLDHSDELIYTHLPIDFRLNV